MATEIVTPRESKNTDDMLLRAAWEVESIACVLQRHFQGASTDDLFTLGLAIRLESLAGAIMHVVSGEPVDLQAARAQLAGPAAVRGGGPSS